MAYRVHGVCSTSYNERLLSSVGQILFKGFAFNLYSAAFLVKTSAFGVLLEFHEYKASNIFLELCDEGFICTFELNKVWTLKCCLLIVDLNVSFCFSLSFFPLVYFSAVEEQPKSGRVPNRSLTAPFLLPRTRTHAHTLTHDTLTQSSAMPRGPEQPAAHSDKLRLFASHS